MKEVETFTILSRGEDKPELTPALMVPIDLSITSIDKEARIVEVLPDFIDALGPYIHVIGHIVVSQAIYGCDAKYLCDAKTPEGQEIGILKVFSTDLF